MLYFGLPCNMDMLQETCNKTRFIVIFRIRNYILEKYEIIVFVEKLEIYFRNRFESYAFVMRFGTCTVSLFSLSKYEY